MEADLKSANEDFQPLLQLLSQLTWRTSSPELQVSEPKRRVQQLTDELTALAARFQTALEEAVRLAEGMEKQEVFVAMAQDTTENVQRHLELIAAVRQLLLHHHGTTTSFPPQRGNDSASENRDLPSSSEVLVVSALRQLYISYHTLERLAIKWTKLTTIQCRAQAQAQAQAQLQKLQPQQPIADTETIPPPPKSSSSSSQETCQKVCHQCDCQITALDRTPVGQDRAPTLRQMQELLQQLLSSSSSSSCPTASPVATASSSSSSSSSGSGVPSDRVSSWHPVCEVLWEGCEKSFLLIRWVITLRDILQLQ